ncbi:unnamed protein product [Callosobruchus maculatus]|uniref:Tyr recombinase domain-containing protein n=1 Tax=Callosobruchus maculatus TaxID=64391 RepID=A0A653D5U3_CALMS|nr:unnamed protein product [Callosobruchus maculatus]
MASSIAPSTIKQYNCSLKAWWKFSKFNNIDTYGASSKQVLSFLNEEFQKGASYSSLNCSRSALSLILSPNVGTDCDIKRFFRGVMHLRPHRPRYDTTWDPRIVLDFLCTLYPNQNLSLEKLTMKLATSLALISAHRVQTLSLIKITNITHLQEGLEIRITDKTKTSRFNKALPVLRIPFFSENIKLCVANTLLSYLEKTKPLRGSIDYLFICHRKPHCKASCQSISRWIKKTLQLSGVDTDIYKAHSTRHASTSAALRSGIPLDTIIATAGWSRDSQTFAKFYNRPLGRSKNVYPECILGLQACNV